MNREEQIAALKAPLDPKNVKPAPAGKYGDYVDAFHVIEEANRIFGHDGWSYSTQRLEVTNNETDGQTHHVGYLAIVEVRVLDCARSDVGHGQGHGKSLGNAHDSAAKEAVTDALKRALRTFGYTFGQALYDKNKEHVATPRDPRAIAEKLLSAVPTFKHPSDAIAFQKREKVAAALDWLEVNAPPMYAEVIHAITSKRDELSVDPSTEAAQ